MILRFFYLLLGLSLLATWSACEKSVDWQLPDTAPPELVIEAILTDEEETQQIRLTQTFADINGAPPAISDAFVVVRTNEEQFEFTPSSTQDGWYQSEIPFAVTSAQEYSLEVIWEGTTYTASSSLSEVFPIPTPFFIPIANTDSMRLGEFVSVFSQFEQALYQVDIDWTHLDTATLTQARLYFYTFSSIDMSQLLPPSQEQVLFPRGSFVTITKYGLNDDFAEYLRAKAIETDWDGNFFFGVSDNLPSNIEPEGLGFFSTCAIERDFFIAE